MMQYLWMFLAAAIAFINGRGVIRWTIAAYLFGVFAVLPLLFLSKKKEQAEEREEMIKEFAERNSIKNELKDVNTVDDLFKQLETK